MQLFPAIDILDGKVVRLKQGDYNKVTVYADNPKQMAETLVEQGATALHVVDLDGAKGQGVTNASAIKEICTVEGLVVEVGGGVRTLDRIAELEQLGVKRVVLGTKLARDEEFAYQAAQKFGSLLVAGVDARDGKVSVQGWTEDMDLDALEFIGRLHEMGYQHLVFTDIAKDGMGTGIDTELYQRVAQAAGFPVVASGGIATLDDLRALSTLGNEVLEGAITGRALYEGAFTLQEAIAALEGR